MKPAFLPFLKKSAALTIVLFVLGLIAFKTFAGQWYLPVFPYLLLAFFLMSLTIQKYLYKIVGMSMLKFSSRFMGITMLKLIGLLIAAVVYVLLNKQDAIAFIVVFFLVYVAFSAIEVYDILMVAEKKQEH